MNTLLLAVTVLSLAAAFISIMSMRKVRHAEQLRSDARVAALMAAADSTPHPAANAGWNSVGGELQWGRREMFKDPYKGDGLKLQFSFKYTFNGRIIGSK